MENLSKFGLTHGAISNEELTYSQNYEISSVTGFPEVVTVGQKSASKFESILLFF